MKKLLALLITLTMLGCSKGKEELPKTAIVDSHPNFFINNYIGKLESNNKLINQKISFEDTLNGNLIYLIPSKEVSVSFRDKYPNLKGLKIKRVTNNVYEVKELICSLPDSTKK